MFGRRRKEVQVLDALTAQTSQLLTEVEAAKRERADIKAGLEELAQKQKGQEAYLVTIANNVAGVRSDLVRVTDGITELAKRLVG